MAPNLNYLQDLLTSYISESSLPALSSSAFRPTSSILLMRPIPSFVWVEDNNAPLLVFKPQCSESWAKQVTILNHRHPKCLHPISKLLVNLNRALRSGIQIIVQLEPSASAKITAHRQREPWEITYDNGRDHYVDSTTARKTENRLP